MHNGPPQGSGRKVEDRWKAFRVRAFHVERFADSREQQVFRRISQGSQRRLLGDQGCGVGDDLGGRRGTGARGHDGDAREQFFCGLSEGMRSIRELGAVAWRTTRDRNARVNDFPNLPLKDVTP